MPIAFLLLNVKPGKEEEVLSVLRSIKEVKEAQRVYGVYDTIVKVEADSMEGLKQVVNNRVKKIENITSVVSLIVMH
ncbi:MAG: Lrp/AsnC ligand binding domain-containing protein [Candidatus Caldarchaeum sp.]|nr:Lrp/AsnC ligand binding domain-containing protein [Candidatus Caldarchaeum sp.]